MNKKRSDGSVGKNQNESQLRETIHKLQLKDASQRLDISKLKEQLQDITVRYHKALKQIGEMEKVQQRDYNYILKIEQFVQQSKKKNEEIKQQQTETYVDALTEMTKQAEELKRKNSLLEIRIRELQEENISMQQQLDKKQSQQIQAQDSIPQFTQPLISQLDEVFELPHPKQTKRSSIFSFNTQDSVNNYDNSFEHTDDNLMQFLHQLDDKQATQLYTLFSQMTEEDSNNERFNNMDNLRRMITERNDTSMQSEKLDTQQSAFSFTQKETHFC